MRLSISEQKQETNIVKYITSLNNFCEGWNAKAFIAFCVGEAGFIGGTGEVKEWGLEIINKSEFFGCWK